jgi:hypothetical protein
MKTGIELIAQERNEQIEKHEWTLEWDVKENSKKELKKAAIALLEGEVNIFPANWDDELCQKMVDKSYKDRLIIAGALIAAEIDRIQI